MRAINEIIIHCTATPENRAVTVGEIRSWHKAQGYNDIGYHYVIMLDGSICVGRSLEIVGAHCLGHNAFSVGVAYVGGVDANGKAKDTRTFKQRRALRRLVDALKTAFPTITKVSGHNEYANKDCPCFDAKNEFKM